MWGDKPHLAASLKTSNAKNRYGDGDDGDNRTALYINWLQIRSMRRCFHASEMEYSSYCVFKTLHLDG